VQFPQTMDLTGLIKESPIRRLFHGGFLLYWHRVLISRISVRSIENEERHIYLIIGDRLWKT